MPGVLADGNYRAVLHAEDVTNTEGQPLVAEKILDFVFKTADSDNDGDVDLNDLGNLASHYLEPGPHTYADGDFDYDDDVDLNDLGTLATHYGEILAPPPLAAPSNVSAFMADNDSIDLVWTDNAVDATSFVIKRSDDGGQTFNRLASNPTSSPYRDTGLDPGTTYYYRLIAANNAGESAPSSILSATTSASGINTLTAQGTAPDEIDFSWTAVTGATKYEIESSFDGIDWGTAPTATRLSSVTSLSFERLDAGLRLFLRVKAYNGNTLLGTSNIAGATTLLPTPGTPGFVEATEPVGGNVTITWAAADEYEDHFMIQRQIDGGAFETIGYAAARSESFVDAVNDPNLTYGYRVQSVNYAGASAFSTTAVAGSSGGQQQQQTPPQQDFLISFYGADPGAVDIDGNVLFLEEDIHNIASQANNYTTLNAPNGEPYRDFEGATAFEDLLEAIDHDDDSRITQTEIDAVSVRVLGWSLGAVEASNFSRYLADTRGLAGGFGWTTPYHLEAEIPVEVMVLIDPVHDGLAPLATLRFQHGPVETNVQSLTTFYQRRGGTSMLDLWLPGTVDRFGFSPVDQVSYTSTVAGFDLLGRPLRVRDGVTSRQVRVDTDTGYRFVQQIHSYHRQSNPNNLDGELYGNEANHSTIVWYVQDEAVQLLS